MDNFSPVSLDLISGERYTRGSVFIASKVVRRLRWSRGWSMDNLAEHAGVSVTVIGKCENETKRYLPRPGTVKKIADALGVQVADILVEEDESEIGGVSITGAVGNAIG